MFILFIFSVIHNFMKKLSMKFEVSDITPFLSSTTRLNTSSKVGYYRSRQGLSIDNIFAQKCYGQNQDPSKLYLP